MSKPLLQTLSVAALYFCASVAGLVTLSMLGAFIGIVIEMPRNWPIGFYIATVAGLVFAGTTITLIRTARRVRATAVLNRWPV